MPKVTRIAREFNQGPPRKWLDLKLGYALLGDRRVLLRYKIAAFAIGFAGVAVLWCLEFPVEEMIALVPFLGIIGDVTLDGVEAIYIPILLACLLLPHLAPPVVVDQIRRERSPVGRSTEGPIIDV